ncbi:MAG TPA: hypothetical protein VEB21_04635 [Terriglobales bacterium]|nr:hypothetical protein [Terriglobales bacterium]
MWKHIDLPRPKLIELNDADGTGRPLRFNGYDFSVRPADAGDRFELTVRLRAIDAPIQPQLRWSERYENEQAACYAVVRIIGAMPEA